MWAGFPKFFVILVMDCLLSCKFMGALRHTETCEWCYGEASGEVVALRRICGPKRDCITESRVICSP